MERTTREKVERRAIDDLMPEETDNETLDREIEEEVDLDAEDLHLGESLSREVMAELGIVANDQSCVIPSLTLKRKRKVSTRTTGGKSTRSNKYREQREQGQGETERAMKRRKVFGAPSLAVREPDGVHIKSAAIVESSSSE